jgi:hypothetical protein
MTIEYRKSIIEKLIKVISTEVINEGHSILKKINIGLLTE